MFDISSILNKLDELNMNQRLQVWISVDPFDLELVMQSLQAREVDIVDEIDLATFIISRGGASRRNNCVCAEILDDGQVVFYGEITGERKTITTQQNLPFLVHRGRSQ